MTQPARVAAPEDVSPIAPFVPAKAGESDGVLTVGPKRAAAFWLDPLDLVRVRTTSGEARFGRVIGAAGTRAVLDEPGVPVEPGVHVLMQPPGHGDVWMVWGREAADVVVERPVRRRGRLVWDDVEREVLAWIDRGDDGPPPALPLVGGAAEARMRLIADRQLARGDAAGRRARARAWLLALRPLAAGPFTLQALDLPGADGSARLDLPEEERLPWQKLAAATRATLDVEGPGLLRVEARATLAAPSVTPRPALRVAVRGGGRLLASASSDADPVGAPEAVSPPPPFPEERPLVADDGQPVGELASATAVLPAGRQRIEIAVEGGPLLVRVTHARRRPRLGQRGDDGASVASAPVWPPPAGAPPELRWVLFLDEARRLAGDDAALRALVEELTEPPPGALMASLAEVLPEPRLIERARSGKVGALELAYRAEPLDPDVRAGYRAAWRAAAFALVPPDDDPGGGKRAPRPPAWTWLVPSDGPGSLSPLPLGAPVTLTAPAAPGRAARLDVFVRTSADAPGPITVRVGDRAFSALALAPLERLELAVPPGANDVIVSAPAGAAAWSSLPPATPVAAPGADLRRYWPLAEEGHSLRYELPDPGVPGPVRVALRVLAPVPGERIRVALRADAGERRTFEIVPGPADAAALPVDAPGAVSGEVAFTARLAPGTRVLWLSAAGKQRVVAQVAVRREPGTGTGTGMGTGDTWARVRELSRGKLGPAELVERAHLLLDGDQGELARQDVLRLSRLAIAPAMGAEVNALLDRLDGARDGTSIEVAATPMALAPGMLGLAPAEALASLAPVARTARLLGASDGLAAVPEGGGPVHAYLRARLSDDPFALARLAAGGEVASLLIEAADRLAGFAGERGAPALLFGLAARARERAEHPRARRAFAVAAALSRWDLLEGTDDNAGQERLPQGEVAPQSPGALAREALLAPPWNPRRAQTLAPGGAAAIDLDLAEAMRLSTQVYCVELKVGPAGPGCVITVKVDGQELRARAIAGGGPGTVPARALGRGRHRVEVTLGRDDARVMASVRFLTDRPLGDGSAAEPDGAGYPVPIERPLRWFAATAERQVTLSVLGPGTLRVDVAGAGPVRIDAGGARHDLVAPGELMILLPDAGAQKVTVAPRAGRVLVRLALRQDAPGAPPPLPQPWWEDAAPSSLLPWPALPAPLTTLGGDLWRGCPPGALGTLSASLEAGGEPLGERDTAARSLVFEVGAAWRRRLGDAPAWLRLGVALRGRESTGPVAAASAEAYARDLPLGLRAGLRAGAATQAFAGLQATGVTGALRLDRLFELGPTLSLEPGVTLRGVWLSLDRATVTAHPDDGVDPDVYNDFSRTRRLLATGRATFWWSPYQDQLGELTLFGAAYSALDHAGANLEWRALFPILGETFAAFGYQPTYRLVTPDRPAAFLRHDLSARLRWSLWTGATGRFVIGIDGDVTATSSGARAVAGLVLRYDYTGGRGLRDILPTEESFDTLVERLRWEPTPPGRL